MAEVKNAVTGIVKEPASISGQLDKLKQRGLIINDENYASETLTYINYYRLVHYFSVFLESGISGKRYKSGTTFEMGLRLYDFDRRLRNSLLKILEIIEVSMRACISNYHALKYGSLGYLNASSFDRVHKHHVFKNKIEYMLENNNGEEFVSHYKSRYNNAFPLWVIMELFSFGMLCYFFYDMKQPDKRELTEQFFKDEKAITHKHLESWLECLYALRNQCAHYNRIYAKDLKVNPRPFSLEETKNSDLQVNRNGTLFDLVVIMKHLNKRRDEWKVGFVAVLENLFAEYKDVVEPDVMGFPANWVEVLLK